MKLGIVDQPDSWVACPTCGAHVEVPLEGEVPVEDLDRVWREIVRPFAVRIGKECQYAQTLRHEGRPDVLDR